MRPSTRAFVGAVVVLALTACAAAGGAASGTPSAPSSADAGASEPPEVPHVPAASGEPGPIPSESIVVALGNETNSVTACGGWIWVQVYSGKDAIVQIDPGTGEVVRKIAGGNNVACLDGETWAAVGGTEVRHIDAETGKTIVSVPAQTYYVTAGAGSVWAPVHGDVVRIDPETAEIVATIEVAPGHEVTDVEGTDDAVWATAKVPGMVYRIDPATNTVVAEIRAGRYAHGIVIAPDAVWVSNAHEETVSRIDPATNLAVAFVEGSGSGVGLALGEGWVWSSSRNTGDLHRIDPASNQATAVVQIGGWPYGIAFADGVLWVSDGITKVYGIPINSLVE